MARQRALVARIMSAFNANKQTHAHTRSETTVAPTYLRRGRLADARRQTCSSGRSLLGSYIAWR